MKSPDHRIAILEKDLAEARALLAMAAEYLIPWGVPRKRGRIEDFLQRTASANPPSTDSGSGNPAATVNSTDPRGA